MKLYIDTADPERIVVGLGKERFTTKARQKKSQILLPFIEKKLKARKKSFADISEIEVNTGPGSFTGLRVGVSIANAIGWSLKVPVNGKRLDKGEQVDIVYE